MGIWFIYIYIYIYIYAVNFFQGACIRSTIVSAMKLPNSFVKALRWQGLTRVFFFEGGIAKLSTEVSYRDTTNTPTHIVAPFWLELLGNSSQYILKYQVKPGCKNKNESLKINSCEILWLFQCTFIPHMTLHTSTVNILGCSLHGASCLFLSGHKPSPGGNPT